MQGFSNTKGANVWRGIRYAAPPTGDLRWKAPRPPAPIEGIFKATKFGERCPQIASRVELFNGYTAGQLIGSEDCLSVNVYAPRWTDSPPSLPVMVWVHGGNNQRGHGGLYDGSRLAAKYQVILVTLQYRLGPLGYFSHAENRMRADSLLDQSANFALLDIIAGLEWVQRNIGVFGGDPHRVTLFGESAGAINTLSLLASPLAKGLFHRAIVQSGGARSFSLDEAEKLHPNSSGNIVQKLGGFDQALTTPTAELFKAYGPDENGEYQFPSIISDGISLPTQPLLTALGSSDQLNKVPLIIGANRDEVKSWQAMDENLVHSPLSLMWRPKDKTFYNTRASYLSRLWNARGVDHVVKAMMRAGHEDIYAYRFDWDENAQLFHLDFATLFGAAHTVELKFVFGSNSIFSVMAPFLFPLKSYGSQQELTFYFQKYWTNLAKTGDPNRANETVQLIGSPKGLPQWLPAYYQQRLIFDSPKSGGTRMMAGFEFVDDIASDLSQDMSISLGQRCDILDGILSWDLENVAFPEGDFSQIVGC